MSASRPARHAGRTFTIALAQLNLAADRDRNRRTILDSIARAAAEGAELVVLPEFSTTAYFCSLIDERCLAWAELDDGASAQAVRAAARRHRIAVVFPFFELARDGRRFNAALVIDRAGDVVGKVRKTSIPRVSRTLAPNETPNAESFYCEPGDLGFPVVELDGVRVGVLVCNDRHYPEAARMIGLQGADLLVIPGATYRGWIKRSWEVECVAHAIMNSYYVAAVNRVGSEEGMDPARSFFGTSLVVDPLGEVIARAGDSTPALLVARIAPERARDARDLWGFFRDRRPDLYAPLAETVAIPVGATVPEAR